METSSLHSLFLESKGVTTDTRKIAEGTIFFALKGDNFNGNSFAQQALELGASYAIIDEEKYAIDERTIPVENVLTALQELAYTHRKFLNLPILALTGSNGKTTTKELINAVLSKKFKTVATVGNLNNHIGVPLTLLAMNKYTELGIVEMGANHIGEIHALAEIAAPDFGYITNFGKAHLEGFGSVEGVIKGKSELYNYLEGHKGTLFLNYDDPIQRKQIGLTHTYSFGATEKADLQIKYEVAQPFAQLIFENKHLISNLIGQYNAVNIAAAAAIGNFFKVNTDEIIEAIEAYIPANNRSQIVKNNNQTLILDAYNANPTSMEAALTNFAQLKSTAKIAVLGDMFELGETAAQEHQYIVDLAKELGLENVILLGNNFSKVKTAFRQYEDVKELHEKGLPEALDASKSVSTILIKGSRGMALERLVDFLK